MSAEQPMDAPPAKRGRSLTGFYVSICVLLVLGLLGAWLWIAWNRWWFDAAEAQRRQAQAARQLGLPVEKAVDLGNGVKIELVLIPAGRFRMGSPDGEKDRWGDEGPVHWVRITKPFYMGKYEVTQEIWEKVMGGNPGAFRGAGNPVDSVSWDDCQEFLKRLARRTAGGLNALGKEPGVFRLPTEAEWEWACRAGTRTRFCFGDEESRLADYAWYGSNSGKTTHPVGEKKPNAWGLYDCHGNVWEWCGDWHESYGHGWWPKVDPTGPVTGLYRVLRGGCWGNDVGGCRFARRGDIGPDDHRDCNGLRLAVSPSRTP